ncbi:peptidase s41 family protein [Gigaspora margarita]|uniref:Peptidase s41 family protein n=1 Tax=Gigaspora margarita TaxID=4874 RepID=A0A8H4ARX9_GIGMA|nr:peptidase s41 family protein [Gigaspora margarita]
MIFYGVLFTVLVASGVNIQYYINSHVPDGCERIHNEFIAKQTTNFTYADVTDCYKSFPLDKDVASKTIDTLTGLMGGFYTFLDKAKESPQPGFDFKAMDLIAELELFRNKSYTTLYDFTIDVEHLFNDLKDAHTNFGLNCFTTFTFYTNMTFYSVVNDGEQKIKVFKDTIDRSNIDCEVTHIDGQKAFQVISEYAKNSVYASRDLGVRFNIALLTSFALRYEIPKKPDITYTLKCNNANEFDVKRSWVAFCSSRTFLNKFNDSKSYFDNVCNPIKGNRQLISSNSKFQEITNIINSANNLLIEQDLSITIIAVVDNFVGFYKMDDFGVVKILTEEPTVLSNAILDSVIAGFKRLANTGVKKVVLDLSDNIGGYLYISIFFNLLLFPNTYTYFDFDTRISEQMRLAITEQFKRATKNNIFDMKSYVNAKTYANFTSANDIFGNNVYTRGGVIGNYSNKYTLMNDSINEMSQYIQNLTTPVSWKPENYIILTNGLCGSSCAIIAEHAVEFNNVTTVAVGGIASNISLSYSSFPGGTVINSTQMFDSLGKLGLLSNNLMPKPFPLTGMSITFPIKEVYSKINPDEILEFAFKPANFRLFYDEKNIRNITKLWSQAAALIGSKR